jgi:hypothetical protein
MHTLCALCVSVRLRSSLWRVWRCVTPCGAAGARWR